MSEPMVRVLDVRCEIHGSLLGVGPAGSALAFGAAAGFVTSRKRLLEVGCEGCREEGKPLPHPLLIATEPVDLKPREEQAG